MAGPVFCPMPIVTRVTPGTVAVRIFWSFGTVGFNLFGNRVALNPGLGSVRDVASTIISHERTQ